MYIILEIANCHGGSQDYMNSLVEELINANYDFGVKLQVFSPDLLASKNFSWHSVYEELFFDATYWSSIICQLTDHAKDVWIDVFDSYSLEITQQNIKKVKGIKLQASTLQNPLLKEELKELLNNNLLDVMLNVSGYTIEFIQQLYNEFKTFCHGNIILQLGYQSYPTQPELSGISKINHLRSLWKDPVQFCYADHTSPNDIWTELCCGAAWLGYDYLEKHIRHSQLEAKYDYHSASTIQEFEPVVSLIKRIQKTLSADFITQPEHDYLSTTIQAPVTKKVLKAGSFISIYDDLSYKRTNSKGLDIEAIKELSLSGHILSVDKSQEDALLREDFHKATIGTLIACRLKSSRLPKKALLKIGPLTSLEWCIHSCLTFPGVNATVVTTSNLEDDKPIAEHAFIDRVPVFYGHPDDVIQRYLDAAEAYKLDVIVRVTADCPWISAEIFQVLLNSHFASGADYSRCLNAALGTACEIYNTQTLRHIRKLFPSSEHSEYMTMYVINNPSHFKINEVFLPQELARDYRLTLDYPEDLQLFEAIYHVLEEQKASINLSTIVQLLDQRPDLVSINQNLLVKYIDDKDFVNYLRQVTTYSK